VVRQACLLGLEGIVSKQMDRSYKQGRCSHWIKLKNRAHPAFTRVHGCSYLRTMEEPLSLTNFTVEADRRPLVVFAARLHEEAFAFFESAGFRDRLRMAKSDGKPLLDDLTILRLRLANASERERFREVGDQTVVLFLIKLDDD
jgi:hypothetical protein